METAARRASGVVNTELGPLARFDFLQLVRTLLRPGRAGEPPRNPDAVLRFRADLGEAFPGRNTSAVELDPRDGRVHVTTPDYCVGSVLGPLPDAFLEWMRELERASQPGMREFLDVFNHRLNVLRYHARAEWEPGLNNEAPERSLRGRWIAALMGVGNDHVAGQIPLRERHWLALGALLADNRRSLASAVRIVAAFLNCPVRMVPLVPAWRPLGAAGQHRLGERRLGEDTVLNTNWWDAAAGVRLDIGPLPYAAMLHLLPPAEGDAAPQAAARELQRRHRALQAQMMRGEVLQAAAGHEQLAALVRLVLDRRQDAQVRIRVPAAQVPKSELRARPAEGSAGLRLGQTAWLKSRKARRRGRMLTVRFDIPAYAPEEAAA
jgi:type VI secretion system protein ImpH